MSESPSLRRAATVAAQLLVIGAAALALLWLIWTLKVVVVPILVALLVCTALAPVVAWLEGRGWPHLAATWTAFVGLFVVVAAVALAVIPPTVAELSDIDTAVQDGAQEIETWLVDGPLDLDRSTVEQYTDDPVGRAASFIESADLPLTRGAVVAAEVAGGALLAVVLTFFFLKDGRRFQRWALDHVPPERHAVVRASAAQAWHALGGYLRGAAILGTVEGIVIGLTVFLAGGSLAVPVGVFTFAAAFFPIVGAVVAGAVATLVVLATAGVVPALVVLGVVILVQQFDNDLLAPVIYGRAVQLSPVVVLVALAVGGTLGGIVGAFLAVPTAAVVSAVGGEVWRRDGPDWAPATGPEAEETDETAEAEPAESPG